MRINIKTIGIVSLFIGLILLYLFNFKSNIHFLLDNDGETYNYQPEDQEILRNSSNVLLRQINIRRRNPNILNKIVNRLSRPKLYYLEFKENKNNFSVGYYENGSTASMNINDETIFSINSSFYNSNFKPNGLINIKGKSFGKTSNSSGHFKIINGKAKAGPTSIFKNNEAVDYSCQSHPSVMKEGLIWDYILNESKNQTYWKANTYRSLVGQNSKGNICFLISGNGGLLSIKEITIIAKQNDIITATCLDAGAALQYRLKEGDFNISFSSMNNKLSIGKKIDKITTKILGKRFYSESPAYINYKKKSNR